MSNSNKISDFSKHCDEFLEEKRKKISTNTYINYSGILKNYSIPFFGNDFELKAELLRNYKDMLIEKNITDNIINAHFRILKIILISANPQSSIVFYELKDEIPLQKKDKKSGGLTKEENNRLENYLLSNIDPLKLGTYLCYKLKMTSGMICALKWSDINIEKRKVYISKIVIRDSNVFRKSPDEPKTIIVMRDYPYKNGRKIFTIPPKTAMLLKELEPENKDVFILTNSSHFIEPRNYQNFKKKCFEDCHILR